MAHPHPHFRRTWPHCLSRWAAVAAVLGTVQTHGLLVPTTPTRRPTTTRLWESREGTDASVVEDDGFTQMFEPTWRRVFRKGASVLRVRPRRAAPRLRKVKAPPKRLSNDPGTLVLVRHGESMWNQNKTFTGWADPDLSECGRREVEHAARLLLEGGFDIDVVYTSRLTRAIRSTWILLREMNTVHLPVYKSWRLNERMYGALTGLSKVQAAETLGEERVQEWRSSLKKRPPALDPTHKHWPGRDRKHADLSMEQIPLTESLQDCMDRTESLWTQRIVPDLAKGRNVLIVAHGNSLRGLVKRIDDIGDEAIQNVGVPTGIPLIYKFDRELKPVPQPGRATELGLTGCFLEERGVLRAALKFEAEWSSRVPGYQETMRSMSSVGGYDLGPVHRSLYKLNLERELERWMSSGNTTTDADAIDQDVKAQATDLRQGMTNAYSGASPLGSALPKPKEKRRAGVQLDADAQLVIIRHGKTEFNKLGLFTGWDDAPLADEGRVEAHKAGRLLLKHGLRFDVVYTSWLSRAIETAWIIVDELDCLWLPIVKSWRLNERMYGALTGLSKKMVAQKHGDARFRAWRRGYKTRPPPVSSFSQFYPGNDMRYNSLLDVRWSFRETVIRSLESGRVRVHRKLPKTESLKDCMDRTIPYFKETIVPFSINNGKRVLIASSENAIRGLLMHLCDIPEERISEIEIPTGLPLIYDVSNRQLQLLDDGTGRDLLEVYNFGTGVDMLFTRDNVCYTAPPPGEATTAAADSRGGVTSASSPEAS